MAVYIEVFGQLLPNRPRRRTLEIQDPVKVPDIAHAIGLRTAQIGLVAIGGIQCELDDEVRPDSRLCFFPYITGG